MLYLPQPSWPPRTVQCEITAYIPHWRGEAKVVGAILHYPADLEPTMTTYIPCWRGEANVVVAASKQQYVSLVFEGNGSNSSTNLESVTNRIMNRMVLHLNHTLPALKLTVY